MRRINKIIIHCSATPEGRFHNAKDIDRWHKERGWTGIGYHYVVLIDGAIEKGRDEEEIGAHTVRHNHDSIGVCYIGGTDKNGNSKDTRTVNQKISLYRLVEGLKKKYPNATIHGHKEFANKDCPSFDVMPEFYPLQENTR